MLFILQLCKPPPPPSVFPLLNTVRVYIQIYSCHRRSGGSFNAGISRRAGPFCSGFLSNSEVSSSSSADGIQRGAVNIHHCPLIGSADRVAPGRVAGALLNFMLGCGLQADAASRCTCSQPLGAACLPTVTELQLWSRMSFIIISHLFCLPNYLINSVVLIALFTVCLVGA